MAVWDFGVKAVARNLFRVCSLICHSTTSFLFNSLSAFPPLQSSYTDHSGVL